jgi:hypothetical protein
VAATALAARAKPAEAANHKNTNAWNSGLLRMADRVGNANVAPDALTYPMQAQRLSVLGPHPVKGIFRN